MASESHSSGLCRDAWWKVKEEFFCPFLPHHSVGCIGRSPTSSGWFLCSSELWLESMHWSIFKMWYLTLVGSVDQVVHESCYLAHTGTFICWLHPFSLEAFLVESVFHPGELDGRSLERSSDFSLLLFAQWGQHRDCTCQVQCRECVVVNRSCNRWWCTDTLKMEIVTLISRWALVCGEHWGWNANTLRDSTPCDQNYI